MSRSRKAKKLPQEPIELVIEDLSHDGRGIAKWNEKVVFVQNALPGETVTAKLSKMNRKYNEAMMQEVLVASDDRVDPKCEYYEMCNGCTMMHLAEEKQIDFKFNALKSNFYKMAKAEPKEWIEPLTDDHWAYRRRARLSVKWVKAREAVLVGFREKNGRFVAKMDFCEVLEKPLADLIQPLAELFAQMDIKAFIPQIECSLGDDELSIIIRHMRPLTDPDFELLKAFGEEKGLMFFLQSKGPDTVKPLVPYGDRQLAFSLPHYGLNYHFLPNDFIQVNRKMNEKMIKQALAAMDLEANDVVLDLFCGLGNFTLPMAQTAAQVVGVEGDERLVERARHNAELNGLSVDFHCADLTKDHSNSAWFNSPYNKVLIDPPRSGAWEILPLIAATKAKTLVYVSCHPASLARDTDRLVNELGFTLEKAGVMDMFPHTSHVESMAIFSRP
ncbi:23S rRNA (uracil(1939)-C(5))-methyltransferase RlmD [Marinicella rhabdoformis]|uniref:23S rRNA (uracil(1939)-C(5))-methyltransferase RlmD n=1 Tax=Marinicella rhabdoformis TaxID=2580566 RepID=UPI0012AECBDC|nr:23S rRNA (uracil(1939)-C(5))-methyltransferase RlmD [Marinicella rhabdoformis]